jgi:cytochrome c oxidase subunit 2
MRRATTLPAAALLASVLAACGATPAALDPQGSGARQIADIAWVLFAGALVIFALVAALTAYALAASAQRRAWIGRHRFVVAAGIAFPAVTLTLLLVYALATSGRMVGARAAAPVRIEIVGEMWWWRIRYLDDAEAVQFATANELHIPVGRQVELRLTTADVLHSFWVPQLGGKLDMIPGRTNVLRIDADTAAVYRGQCAEYCGAQHAKMAMHVVAEPVDEFERWLDAQRADAVVPATPELSRGMALFVAHCGVCHAVRGTAAAGPHGPDLTHVASRRYIAAGTLPNNAGTLAAWIASSQRIKPHNRMPAFAGFASEELLSLAAYLESLR